MTNKPLKIFAVAGSVRSNSFNRGLLDAAKEIDLSGATK